MIPKHLRPFFWDIEAKDFNPTAYPQYTITRVLEYGDDKAVAWLKEQFSERQIREVLRTEPRLSRKSANFWAIVYHIPRDEVAALRASR